MNYGAPARSSGWDKLVQASGSYANQAQANALARARTYQPGVLDPDRVFTGQTITNPYTGEQRAIVENRLPMANRLRGAPSAAQRMADLGRRSPGLLRLMGAGGANDRANDMAQPLRRQEVRALMPEADVAWGGFNRGSGLGGRALQASYQRQAQWSEGFQGDTELPFAGNMQIRDTAIKTGTVGSARQPDPRLPWGWNTQQYNPQTLRGNRANLEGGGLRGLAAGNVARYNINESTTALPSQRTFRRADRQSAGLWGSRNQEGGAGAVEPQATWGRSNQRQNTAANVDYFSATSRASRPSDFANGGGAHRGERIRQGARGKGLTGLETPMRPTFYGGAGPTNGAGSFKTLYEDSVRPTSRQFRGTEASNRGMLTGAQAPQGITFPLDMEHGIEQRDHRQNQLNEYILPGLPTALALGSTSSSRDFWDLPGVGGEGATRLGSSRGADIRELPMGRDGWAASISQQPLPGVGGSSTAFTDLPGVNIMQSRL
jgi:hypothetical protein